jgi:hypothetical protein
MFLCHFLSIPLTFSNELLCFVCGVVVERGLPEAAEGNVWLGPPLALE